MFNDWIEKLRLFKRMREAEANLVFILNKLEQLEQKLEPPKYFNK